jgi:hypothetical protein
MLSRSAAVGVRIRALKHAVGQLPNDFDDLIGTVLPDQRRGNITVEWLPTRQNRKHERHRADLSGRNAVAVNVDRTEASRRPRVVAGPRCLSS